jgi:hypothetical protein
MAKDYLNELDDELSKAGGLTGALDNGAKTADALKETGQPAQKFTVSQEAETALEQFQLKRAGQAQIFVQELLEKGILNPSMPLSDLPAFLKAFQEKLMRGEE